MNLETLIEFIKITIISLEQDLEGISSEMELLDPESKDCKELDFEYNYIRVKWNCLTLNPKIVKN